MKKQTNENAIVNILTSKRCDYKNFEQMVECSCWDESTLGHPSVYCYALLSISFHCMSSKVRVCTFEWMRIIFSIFLSLEENKLKYSSSKLTPTGSSFEVS